VVLENGKTERGSTGLQVEELGLAAELLRDAWPAGRSGAGKSRCCEPCPRLPLDCISPCG